MGNYTLVITEKPDAANRIATALDISGKPKKATVKGVPYYEAYNNGNILVVPALGHLYTIMSRQKGKRNYPVFDYEWVPLHVAERKASKIRLWLNGIAELAKNAENFIDACDFDIEGSIIGYCILKYACGSREQIAKRMKYSTLTKEELQESYSNLLEHLDFELVQAGLTRHEVDWLYGINLSRALTQAAKESGQYATLSTGRVQGPTLKFLESREQSIQCFVPTPYWTINAKIEINGITFEVQYERALEVLAEAEHISKTCRTKEGKVENVTVNEHAEYPPVPFDLTTLQSEAYRIFKYTPMRTSSILQRLYLDALISYPRTSSQKLPQTIGYKNILSRLLKAPAYSKQASELLSKQKLIPNEGKKIDPAHPAIYPTGNLPNKPLGAPERDIFDLVVKRFLAVFGVPATLQSVNASVLIEDYRFNFNATRTLMEGWMKYYKPYIEPRNEALPPLVEGQMVNVKHVLLDNHFTKPPARYNPRSLLLKMEKEEIGTKATRAATIQTLQERKYIKGTDSFAVSDLGFEVIEVLSRYCPIVVSPEMTRKLEQEMDQIQHGKQTKQAVLQNTIATLKEVTAELKDKEQAIGKQLNRAIKEARLEERTVGFCPKCSDGQLVVLHSKKTGKRFVGCTNYFNGKCNMAFPLPQTGLVKPLRTNCKTCGSPIIAVYGKGRKPWKLCINPKCPSKGGKAREMQSV